MDRKTDDLYINYIIARFGHIVVEYLMNKDFMENKNLWDWNHYLQLFATEDPYHHLRSIHNGNRMFDNNNLSNPSSIQNENTENARELRKNSINLSMNAVEGNICWSWGCLTAEELVNKFCSHEWRVGHGETILAENPSARQRFRMPNYGGRRAVLRGHSPNASNF